jgi:hypothetical protein
MIFIKYLSHTNAILERYSGSCPEKWTKIVGSLWLSCVQKDEGHDNDQLCRRRLSKVVPEAAAVEIKSPCRTAIGGILKRIAEMLGYGGTISGCCESLLLLQELSLDALDSPQQSNVAVVRAVDEQ